VKTWKTRDGRVIPIHEMDDVHLVNTLRMLRRKCMTTDEILACLSYASTTGGEMASYAAEQEAMHAVVMPSVFDDLVAEADRRGIDWRASRG
jgi:hypothetical protein